MAATETLDYDSARQFVRALTVVQQELEHRIEQGASSPLISEQLTSVKEMFGLSLKDGRQAEHQIPGAAQKRPVKEVDLQNVFPPIADYDAIAFQKAFAELRQRIQTPVGVSQECCPDSEDS